MKKKNLILLLACCCTIIPAAMADGASKLTLEERQARKEKVFAIQMRRNGGMVRKEGSMTGRIVIVDAQTKVDGDAFKDALEQLRKTLRMDITIEKGNPVTLATAPGEFKKTRANMALFIVEDDSIPGTILVMPENGWGILNIAPLAAGAGKEKFVSRVVKETVRAFALVAGGANSQYPHSLTGPVTKPEDLDAIDSSRLPADMQARIFNYAEGFGVKPYIQTTYLNACREGWAPAPTNEFQKAIWEKIKADKERGPTNPILIPPPKAKK